MPVLPVGIAMAIGGGGLIALHLTAGSEYNKIWYDEALKVAVKRFMKEAQGSNLPWAIGAIAPFCMWICNGARIDIDRAALEACLEKILGELEAIYDAEYGGEPTEEEALKALKQIFDRYGLPPELWPEVRDAARKAARDRQAMETA